jgi:hypothetical protein
MNSQLTKTALAVVLLSVSFTIMNAQDLLKKHSIGLEGPISLNSSLFTGESVDYMLGLRYGYHLNKSLTIGPEASGYYRVFKSDNTTGLNEYGYRFGGYARYTFIPNKRISPFIEGAMYWNNRHWVPGTGPVFDGLDEFTKSKLGVYVAPGVTLKTENRRLSLDLMYLFSNTRYINEQQHGFSFKVNYHF